MPKQQATWNDWIGSDVVDRDGNSRVMAQPWPLGMFPEVVAAAAAQLTGRGVLDGSWWWADRRHFTAMQQRLLASRGPAARAAGRPA
jgi:hypothetical protein